MVDDHVRAGRQAVKAVDATINPEAFQTWLLRDKELANKVTRGILNKSVVEVQDAARTYLKNRDTATESALVGKGIGHAHRGQALHEPHRARTRPEAAHGRLPGLGLIAVTKRYALASDDQQRINHKHHTKGAITNHGPEQECSCTSASLPS